MWGEEITPCDAALYLGNLDAFRLLYDRRSRKDEMLYLALALALPRFVEWLLET